MHLIFAPYLDAPHWLGPVPPASMDVRSVGAVGCLQLLEAQAGCTAPHASTPVRIAQMAQALRSIPTAWQPSAERDLLGTAEHLLRSWDSLRLHGWQPQSGVLPELASLGQPVAPGLPDRVHGLQAALAQTPSRVRRLTLVDPLPTLPAAWQALCLQLQAGGAQLDTLPTPRGATRNDLAQAATRSGEFRGDSALQLYRPPTPGGGAEHVAAWVEAVGSQHVCVLDADAVLDAALAERGLPTHGAPSFGTDAAMQLIPLTLQLAYAPIDPGVVTQWLTLHPHPLSPRLRHALLQALRMWPAVDSPTWQEAVQAHFADAPPGDRERRHFDRLLGTASVAPLRDAYPLAELLERCSLLKNWLLELPLPPRHVVQAVTHLALAAQALGSADLPQGQVQRLLALCLRDTPTPPPHPPEAHAASSTPAGILAVAPHVVWWNCTAEAVPPLRPMPLTHAETVALQAQGVGIPAMAELASAQAQAWRRPLLAAQQTLLCVAPWRNAHHEPSAPHPVWDEIVACMPPRDRASIMVRLTVQAPRHPRMPILQQRTARPPPTPATVLQLQRAPRRDGPESPSSLETLVGCSFKWAVHYAANVRPWSLPGIDVTPLQLGTMAHWLLSCVITDPHATPDGAAERLAELLHTEGPRRVAALFWPRHALALAQLQRHSQNTARALVRLRDAHGFSVRASELDVEKAVTDDLTLRGRIDVLLDQPPAVLDFKYGSASRYREALRRNAAAQLAAYAFMVGEANKPLPGVGYFIVLGAQLHTAGLPFGVSEAGADVQQTWEGLRAAALQARAALAQGVVQATGNDPVLAARHAATLEAGVLQVPPPCGYCAFGSLCRRDRP